MALAERPFAVLSASWLTEMAITVLAYNLKHGQQSGRSETSCAHRRLIARSRNSARSHHSLSKHAQHSALERVLSGRLARPVPATRMRVASAQNPLESPPIRTALRRPAAASTQGRPCQCIHPLGTTPPARASRPFGKLSMAWTLLVIAGLFEVGWAIGLKYTAGFTRLWPSVATAVAMIASVVMLSWAVRTLPVGTAYAVWTGIGAAGTVLLGILLFNEPATATRIACVALIVLGIVGLRVCA